MSAARRANSSDDSSLGNQNNLSRGFPSAEAFSRLQLPVVSRLMIATRKALCLGLAASLLFLGSARGSAGAGTRDENVSVQTRLSAKTLIFNPHLPTQEEMHDSYMQQGTEYAQNEESREQAIQYFAKAIALDMNKSLRGFRKNIDM